MLAAAMILPLLLAAPLDDGRSRGTPLPATSTVQGPNSAGGNASDPSAPDLVPGVNLSVYDQIREEKNIPFLGRQRKERIDVYLPVSDSRTAFPAILIIHGGGWTIGSRAGAREEQMAKVFAHAGFVAASTDYLLDTGSGCWLQCLCDCKTAVRFLRKYAAHYQVNPDKIGVIGGSAGGHLSMMVAFTGGNPHTFFIQSKYGDFRTLIVSFFREHLGVPR